MFLNTRFIAIIILMILSFHCSKDNPTEPENKSPIIQSITATPDSVFYGGTSQLSVVATDPESANLSYNWATAIGIFTTSTTNATVNWQAPQDSSGSFSCTVTVSDGEKTAEGNIQIFVKKPLINGRWRNDFSISGTSYTAYTQLTQNGTTLTGTWEASDGSGHQNIGSDSYINGKSIKITFLIGTFSSYFIGTVSDNFQSMSGDFYVIGLGYVSSWSATKTSLAKITDSPFDVPVVNKLHELIKKL